MIITNLHDALKKSINLYYIACFWSKVRKNDGLLFIL